MKHLVVALLIGAPSAAFAQAPQATQAPQPPQAAQAPQATQAAQPTQAVNAELQERHGLTVEANVGIGMSWTASAGSTSDSAMSLAGLNAGIGGWLTPSLALTLRVAGATTRAPNGRTMADLASGFVGPALQFWDGEHRWFGGGLGLGFAAARVDNAISQPPLDTGVALDVRAGLSSTAWHNQTLNLSFEMTVGLFQRTNVTGNSLSVLVGYQFL